MENEITKPAKQRKPRAKSNFIVLAVLPDDETGNIMYRQESAAVTMKGAREQLLTAPVGKYRIACVRQTVMVSSEQVVSVKAVKP